MREKIKRRQEVGIIKYIIQNPFLLSIILIFTNRPVQKIHNSSQSKVFNVMFYPLLMQYFLSSGATVSFPLTFWSPNYSFNFSTPVYKM